MQAALAESNLPMLSNNGSLDGEVPEYMDTEAEDLTMNRGHFGMSSGAMRLESMARMVDEHRIKDEHDVYRSDGEHR